MDRIKIIGGNPLNGTIPISGAKNAALPLMIASLLTDGTLTLENLPRLADVSLLVRILGNHGVDYTIEGKRAGDTAEAGQTVHLAARTIVDTTAPYDLVSRMRASFWVLAPLLARTGEAKVSLPGGCAIGTRPVDLLLTALEQLGAEIEIENGYVVAKAKNGLRGGVIDFAKVTVGGTHTALMAASLAKGHTLIKNAAREPEVVDLADCLRKMGAKISGDGTTEIEIEGVARLGGARHAVLPDRIETGTYAMAVAMTGGDILLSGARENLLSAAFDTLRGVGATVTETNDGVRVSRNGNGLAPVDITTEPFPRFPDGSAGAVHGADDARERHVAHHRNDIREPLHARGGTRPARGANPSRRRRRDRRRRRSPGGRAGDGDRPAGVRIACDRGAGSARRDHRQPRVPPRPWVRTA